MNPNVQPAERVDGVVPMTPELARALEGLRDLHAASPDALSGAATVVATLLVLVLVAVSGCVLWRSPRRRALRDLARLRAGLLAGGRLSEAAAGVQRLLHAEATRGGRKDPMPPGLCGEAWLNWLAERAPAGDRDAFRSGAGRLLLDLPYAPPGAAADSASATATIDLFDLAGRWLARSGRARSKP